MAHSAEALFLIASILVFISVIASRATDRLGLPALLLFLGIGMLAGSEGPGGIHFDNVSAAKSLGIIALAVILFYGGMDTKWKHVKPVLGSGILLATLGVLFTAVITGAAAFFIAGLPLAQSMLLGAVVSSTDAAAVFSILRSRGVNLKDNMRSVLELESGSNDPMAIFLTLGIMGIIGAGGAGMAALVPKFFWEMGSAIIAGYLLGKILVFLINKINLEFDGLYPVLTMSLLIMFFSLALKAGINGYLCVYAAGIVMCNSDFIHRKNLTRFHEGMAWLAQIGMFLMFGLLVFPSALGPVAVEGLLVAAALIFIARPAATFICLAFTKYTFKEKLLLSWVGLKGAVPIILALFPLMAGIEGGQKIFNIVFFVVLVSALLQGSTIPLVSKLLGLEEKNVVKKRYPIEFEATAGIDADLNEVFVPYESEYVGKRLFEIGIPKGSLVTLVSRGEQFIIPDGGTVIEGGDVMLVMAEKQALKELEKKLAVQREKKHDEKDGGDEAV
ncbi:MAG TPA: potassium/proton antiporter [bacterium]|nr:potassium/proton antiporter [bacterium]